MLAPDKTINGNFQRPQSILCAHNHFIAPTIIASAEILILLQWHDPEWRDFFIKKIEMVDIGRGGARLRDQTKHLGTHRQNL